MLSAALSTAANFEDDIFISPEQIKADNLLIEEINKLYTFNLNTAPDTSIRRLRRLLKDQGVVRVAYDKKEAVITCKDEIDKCLAKIDKSERGKAKDCKDIFDIMYYYHPLPLLFN